MGPQHGGIKLNQFPKVYEITCLNTTVNDNNSNKKITFKPPKLEGSILTKFHQNFKDRFMIIDLWDANRGYFKDGITAQLSYMENQPLNTLFFEKTKLQMHLQLKPLASF